MKWLLGLLVAAVLALGACTRGGLQEGEGRLVFDNAEVSLARGSGPYRAVADDVTVHSGDRIRLTSGEATLRLPDKARILLRRGSNMRLEPEPVLLRGDLIALPGSKPLTVRALESTVVARSGAVRIRSGLGVTAGVYNGLAQLVTAGQTLNVSAYRQATITAYGLLPDRPSPLRYDQESPDAWDVRYLSSAIELTADLRDRSNGFTHQLREGQGRTLGFYRLLLPQLDRERGVANCLSDVAVRPQGETLVGAGIALESNEGGFLERCQAAFAFRDDGATWGLVALDQGVTNISSIRRVLADAVGRLPSSSTFVAPAADAPIEAAAPIDGTPTTPTTPTNETPRGGDVGDPATPTPAEEGEPGSGLVPGVPGLPAEPPQDGEPQPSLLEPLLDPVEGVLGGLLGGLLG
jgi:hypothetical protein